ncbi:hypothetical protein GDO81_021744 [Engystomops pustulosus]|uniref:Uncharacterized protein n=1 Tax=Engystomops pustulosus TaxID=76066 RepID=A0AAV6YNC5_ENGPU|nr:hypothetical protein GDO81_021744 [Engystomops pustulosus]
MRGAPQVSVAAASNLLSKVHSSESFILSPVFQDSERGERRVINPDVEFFLIDGSRSPGEDRRFYTGYAVVSGAHEVVQAEPLPPHRSAQEVK